MLSNSNLQFFNIGKYGGLYTDTADFSRLPRPYFNIGMVLKGNAVFYAENSEPVSVTAGEIIVVPTGAVYVSRWVGNPEISYITFHFILEKCFDKIYNIQKISGVERLKSKFEFAYEKFSDPSYSFKILEIFYGVLSEVYPKIIKSQKNV